MTSPNRLEPVSIIFFNINLFGQIPTCNTNNYASVESRYL